MTRFNRRNLLYGCFALLLPAITYSAKADNIDDYIRTQMRWQHIPGLSMAVVKDGRIIKAKGYGLANMETNTPATPATVYKIGSVSKQFLAAGIMLLVEQGKVALDDKISKYLDGAPETWKDISIRHLLTHTSGLVREAPGFDPLKVLPDAEVIKTAYLSPLRFAPGERWAYSNLNYYCLAEVIHKVTDKPWSQFISDRIFARSGMSATRTTTTTAIVPCRASGYTSTENGQVNSEIWLALRPSGAFLSNVLDFAKWDAALYTDAILNRTSRFQMWSPVRLNDGKTFDYGFGWFLDSFQGHKRVYHSGGVPGFVCQFDRFVDDGLTVILMANVDNRDLSDVAVNVAAFYAPVLKPPLEKPIMDTEPQIAMLIKRMLEGLAKGKLDANRCSSDMAVNLTNELKSGAFNVLNTFGPVQTFLLLERKNDGGDRVYRYHATYRSISLFIECTFGKDDKITKFGLHD